MWKRTLATTAALLLAVGCSSQTTEDLGGKRGPNLSAADNDYFRDITLSNMTELQSSQMALQVSANPQVKEFAQHMINDHTSAGSQVAAVADTKGVTPPKTLDAKHQDLLSGLKGKSGADFDRAYLQLQVDAHEMTVNLDQAEADNGNDADVKSLANSLLPTLKGHLQMAKHALAGMGGSM